MGTQDQRGIRTTHDGLMNDSATSTSQPAAIAQRRITGPSACAKNAAIMTAPALCSPSCIPVGAQNPSGQNVPSRSADNTIRAVLTPESVTHAQAAVAIATRFSTTTLWRCHPSTMPNRPYATAIPGPCGPNGVKPDGFV